MRSYSDKQRFDLQFKYHNLGYSSVDKIRWTSSKTYTIKNVTYFSNKEFLREFCYYINVNALSNIMYLEDEEMRIFCDNENCHNDKAYIVTCLVMTQHVTEQFLEDYYDEISLNINFASVFNNNHIPLGFLRKHGIDQKDKNTHYYIKEGNTIICNNKEYTLAGSCNDENFSRTVINGYFVTITFLREANGEHRYTMLYTISKNSSLDDDKPSTINSNIEYVKYKKLRSSEYDYNI
jgi:hypothetical protein